MSDADSLRDLLYRLFSKRFTYFREIDVISSVKSWHNYKQLLTSEQTSLVFNFELDLLEDRELSLQLKIVDDLPGVSILELSDSRARNYVSARVATR